MTRVTARKRLGLLFLFAILSQYDEGMDILDHTFERKSTTTVKDVVELFEALDAWLMLGTFWDSSNSAQAMQSARLSIESLLKLCKKHPCCEGKLLKIPEVACC